tara:strand:+ start:166 stop:423 length:258 start_codon:yes stop_codon:yes gene_type:complete
MRSIHMLMHIPHTLMLQGHLQEYAVASGALIATMAAETYDAIAAGDTLLKDLDLPWALQAVEQTDGSENLPSYFLLLTSYFLLLT